MSYIPEDVMKAASAADCREGYHEITERIVARAILAEREKATKIERERIAKLFDDRAARIKERMDKFPAELGEHPDTHYYRGALIDAAMIRGGNAP